MKTSRKMILSTAIVCRLIPQTNFLAQEPSLTPDPEVPLASMAPLTYPPLARQTRISGDVELLLQIRPDGTVVSVTVVKGHPLLARAAVDNAQQLRFECRNCGENGLSQRFVYTFVISLEPAPCPGEKDLAAVPYPQISQSNSHISVTHRPLQTCDPAGRITKTKQRSARCLYLWRCGWRAVSTE